MGAMNSNKLPQFVLFGDSLTSWSFDEHTEGFGWYLEGWYNEKAEIVNEGHAGYTTQIIKGNFRKLIDRITQPDAPRTLLFTIFLGANDACLVGNGEYVPLPKFEANIREFVETILVQDALADTKIILITPPPINIPDPTPESKQDDVDLGPSVAAALANSRADSKKSRGFRTYMSKKRYAEKIMEIAKEYEETGRVVGLNYWRALVDAALAEQGRLQDADRYDEERLPGCGLQDAKQFRDGYFTDGLHLSSLGYKVLSKELLEVMLGKWPDLAPDTIHG